MRQTSFGIALALLCASASASCVLRSADGGEEGALASAGAGAVSEGNASLVGDGNRAGVAGDANGGGVLGDSNVAPGASSTFAKGADVSWLAMMESYGYGFVNDAGQAQNAVKILQDKGVNFIRIRALVNPPANGLLEGGDAIGFCDTASVVKQAQRARAANMRVLIDLMLSDTWTDPGHQAKPAAWAALSFAQLQAAVATYTTQVMKALADVGITPEWVQVGNEITGGLLWPDGKYDQFPQLTQLLISGYRAVKAVSPTTRVIVHLDNGFNNGQYRWFFDNYTKNGGQLDAIGMSCYPNGDDVATLAANMQDVVSRYGKPVFIAEFGMPSADPAAAKTTLVAVQKAVSALPGGQGLGVFYWEPDHAPLPVFGGYALGAAKLVADHTLQFTAAMDAFGVPIATAAASLIDPASAYQLVNRGSGRALGVAGGSRAAAGPLEEEADGQGAGQTWQVLEPQPGVYTLKNINSGLFADASAAAEGAQVVQSPRDGGAGQAWRLDPVGGGAYRLVSRATGGALSSATATAAAATVALSPPGQDGNQVWELRASGVASTPAGGSPPPAPPSFDHYLAAFFTSQDETGLYYAISADGYKFAQSVKGGAAVLHATLDDKLLRDPQILRDPTNTFRLVATVSNTHPKFQIYDSVDLISWKNGRLVDVTLPNTSSSTCWAPELFYDAPTGVSFAYWTATPNGVWNDTSIYYSKTSDFLSWTPPALLLKDPGGAVMDADIKAFGGQYIMVYRYNGQIWQRTAAAALGPYGSPQMIFTDNVEGPYAFPLNDGSGLGIVFDQYGGNQGRWGVGQSSDARGWSYVTAKNYPYYNAQAFFPPGVRHGAVLPISAAEAQAIAGALGETAVPSP